MQPPPPPRSTTLPPPSVSSSTPATPPQPPQLPQKTSTPPHLPPPSSTGSPPAQRPILQRSASTQPTVRSLLPQQPTPSITAQSTFTDALNAYRDERAKRWLSANINAVQALLKNTTANAKPPFTLTMIHNQQSYMLIPLQTKPPVPKKMMQLARTKFNETTTFFSQHPVDADSNAALTKAVDAQKNLPTNHPLKNTSLLDLCQISFLSLKTDRNGKHVHVSSINSLPSPTITHPATSLITQKLSDEPQTQTQFYLSAAPPKKDDD